MTIYIVGMVVFAIVFYFVIRHMVQTGGIEVKVDLIGISFLALLLTLVWPITLGFTLFMVLLLAGVTLIEKIKNSKVVDRFSKWLDSPIKKTK